MPTYEYECRDCGHNFDAFQNISADPVSVCPKCNGKVKRMVGTGSGFIFKGKGFPGNDIKKNVEM